MESPDISDLLEMSPSNAFLVLMDGGMSTDVFETILKGKGSELLTAQSDEEEEESEVKCSINDELTLIQNRMERCLRFWDMKNCRKMPERKRSIGDFPTGFGFYLMDDKHRPAELERETDLGQMYDVIMSLHDSQTQDRLLSFLDDFHSKRNLLQRIRHDRYELIKDVAEWMHDDNVELKKVESAHLSVAVEREPGLRARYMTTLALMEKLCEIKKQIEAEEDRVAEKRSIAASAKRGKNDRQKSVSSRNYPDDVKEEFVESSPEGGSWIPAKDLLKLVHEVKDDQNEAEMEVIEHKLRDFISTAQSNHDRFQAAKASLEKKQEDLVNLNEKQALLKEETTKMHNSIAALEDTLQREQLANKKVSVVGSARKIKRGVSAKSATTFKQVETQTGDSLLYLVQDQYGLATKSDMYLRPKKTHSKGSPTTRRSATSHVEKAVPNAESSECFPPLIPSFTSSRTSQASSVARGYTPKKRKGQGPYKLDEPKEDEGQQRSVSVLLQFVCPRPGEGTTFSIEAMAAFLEAKKNRFNRKKISRYYIETRADSKGEEVKAEVKAEVKLEGIPIAPGQQLPVLPSTSGPPETLEVLREILKDFVDKTVLHAKELLRDVMVLRNNAREEIQKLEVKVEVMSDVEATLKWVSDVVQVHHRQLPYMERNTTCVKVLNRQPVDHQCRFCVCQKTIAEKTDLIGGNPEESLSVIEHQIRSYVLSLERVKLTYMEVVSLIATAQESVKGFLSDLLWCDPGTSGHSELDEDMDYEIMDAVQETLNIPEDTEELIRHAGFISHTLDSLTLEILDTLSHTTARMAEVKTQNECLDKVEEHTKKIRHLMDVTALDVARTRSREDYVQTSRILKGCVCPYCICYNSPFPDGTRKNSKKQREAQKENLIMNISQLQQMMSLVLTTVEGPDHPLVSGVDPVVLDLVESAQTNLYSALDIILGDEERNKRRAESDPSGVSQSLNL